MAIRQVKRTLVRTVTEVIETLNRCAVVGCAKEGKPHRCPYDGSSHHHGRIHYDCGYPVSSLTFHQDQWDLICDEHYAVCCAERSELERRNSVAEEGDGFAPAHDGDHCGCSECQPRA